MRVEPVRDDHFDAWIDMRADLWPEVRRSEHCADAGAILTDPERRTVAFVAVSDAAQPIGFVEVSLRRDYVNGCDTSPVAFLEGLYVRPAHRRLGIAGRMLQAAEQWGRSLGCSELGSDTDWENPQGQAFHAALGFEETERVVFYRKLL